jgi:predicted transcriptional regulator
MQRQFATADPHEMLESVLARLQNCNCHSLPVVRDGVFIGLLSADDLGELLLIQEAMRQAQQRRRIVW